MRNLDDVDEAFTASVVHGRVPLLVFHVEIGRRLREQEGAHDVHVIAEHGEVQRRVAVVVGQVGQLAAVGQCQYLRHE